MLSFTAAFSLAFSLRRTHGVGAYFMPPQPCSGPGRRRLSSLCYRAARLGPAEKAQSTLMVEPMRVDPFISSMAPCASFCFSYSTRA